MRARKALQTVFGVLLLLAIVIASCVAIVVAFGWLLHVLKRADGNVQAALITALVGVVVVVIGRIWDTRIKNEERRREKMVPIYDSLIDVFVRISKSDGDAEAEILERFERIQQEMLIWAPSHVIKQFVAWRESVTLDETDPRELLLSWERVILAMRKDLGNGSSNLAEGDLLRVILTDWNDQTS